MLNALSIPAVQLSHSLPAQIADLRGYMHACVAENRAALSALHHQLESHIFLHSDESHIDNDASGLRLRVKTPDGFIETRRNLNDELNGGLLLLAQQLWPDTSQSLSRRAWFVISLHGRDTVFQLDHIQNSAGSTYSFRRLYDLHCPLPQLEQLHTLSGHANQVRKLLAQTEGLVLIADQNRNHRVKTARAIAQCMTSPDRRIMMSEATCHPLIPGITQITLPLEATAEHYKAWRQACDTSYDVIIALDTDHEPSRLTQLASENTLVVQGVCAGNASGALGQLLASGVRPEAIARALNGIIVQYPVPLICQHCKIAMPVDDELNEWMARHSPVRSDEIHDWLSERLTDSFAQAQGCSRCDETGISRITMCVECITVPDHVLDALSDGDIRYAMHCLDAMRDGSDQIVKLARTGQISFKHAKIRMA